MKKYLDSGAVGVGNHARPMSLLALEPWRMYKQYEEHVLRISAICWQ